MAQYNTQYRLLFNDYYGIEWSGELALRDGMMIANPPILEGTESPIRLDKRNNDEQPLSPIVQTTCTFSYIVNSDNDPLPDLFTNIDATQWLVTVYRNGAVYWRGFLDGKSNTFPWIPYPFPQSLTASDFEFLNGVNCDINLDGILYYDFVNIGEWLNRTLLQAIPFADPQVNILYIRKPDIIGEALITSALYLHTDSIYEFLKEPITVYQAIERFVSSAGARIFFENGAYWIQFISDISTDPQNVIVVTPQNTFGEIEPNFNTTIFMGNTSSANLTYLNQTQEVLINRALKSQSFHYELKAINRLLNFDWRDNTNPPFEHWESSISSSGFYSRIGTGSGEDTYRLIVPPLGSDPNAAGLLSDVIAAQRGQIVEVSIKTRAILNLPPFSGVFPEDYKVGISITVTLSDDRYFLSTSGEWISGDNPPSTDMYIESTPGKDGSEITIVSKPIPMDIPLEAQHLAVFIFISGITPEPPVGSTYYTELYPISVGVFSDRFTLITERVVNNGNYYDNADPIELFFNDTQRDSYSNTIFYKDGEQYLPLPAGSWTGGKDFDELTVRQYMDLQARQNWSVTGDFLGRNVYFYNNVKLIDRNNMNTFILRDEFDVRSSIHKLMVREILPVGSADMEYTVISTNERDGDN